MLYFLIVLPFDYNDIMLTFQIDEIDGYSWVNFNDLYQMIHKGEKKTVEGYLFNNKTFQFDKSVLDEYNFCDIPNKINKSEYMPHGHRSAIKVIYEKNKLSTDNNNNIKFLDG